jgi:hypothetical protein
LAPGNAFALCDTTVPHDPRALGIGIELGWKTMRRVSSFILSFHFF